MHSELIGRTEWPVSRGRSVAIVSVAAWPYPRPQSHQPMAQPLSQAPTAFNGVCNRQGQAGFQLGGGVNRGPQNGGGGSGKRAQLTGPSISHYELWWRRRRNGQFFFTKYMANDDFSEPPRRTDSTNPIFTFCRFLGLGHLRGPGVSLGRISGPRQLSPFLGWGAGSSKWALSNPPAPRPLQLKARLPQQPPPTALTSSSSRRPDRFRDPIRGY